MSTVANVRIPLRIFVLPAYICSASASAYAICVRKLIRSVDMKLKNKDPFDTPVCTVANHGMGM